MLNVRVKIVALMTMMASLLPHAVAQEVEVCTDYWPPYVNGPQDELGVLARRVDVILDNAGIDFTWRYSDFSYCQFKTGKADRDYATFPWFYNAERAEEYYLSAPIYEATNQIYFNRQFNTFADEALKLDDYKLGRVAGYFYGDTINAQFENATIFNSELAALRALLTGEIDLLPLADDVLQEVLERHFPNRWQLIRPLPGIAERSPLHVMAPRTKDGKDFIDRFDASMRELVEAGAILATESLNQGQSGKTESHIANCPSASAMGDLAQVIASEGFPVIMGQEIIEGKAPQYVAIPQGTNVIVVCWSSRIAKATQSDRLYKTMVDESRVVILDGPHVGKEVLVKNMHLAVVAD